MRKMSRWGLAALALACVAGAGSCINAKNPNTATQAFMWVATTGDQMVRSYTVQLNNGAVAQVGNAISTGVQPQAMAITPDGQTVFIANTGDGTIGSYAVTSDGSLSSVGSPAPTGGQLPIALAVDPTGKLLFAVNQGTFNNNTSGSISVFAVGSGGLSSPKAVFLTEMATDTTGSGPSGIAISPGFSCILAAPPGTKGPMETCFSLYVANQFTNTVTAYDYFVDSNGNFVLGAINPLSLIPHVGTFEAGVTVAGSPYSVGTNPTGLAFSRCAGVTKPTAVCTTGADNDNLFVSNAGSNNISVFSACIQVSTPCAAPIGTLTAVGAPVAACCGPTNLIVNPQANFVYVLEAGAAQVGQFRYAPVNGTLTPLSPASASTGPSPFAASISANTSNTNWVFVSNTGASTISGFAITGAGRLTGLSSGPFAVPAQPAAILLH